MGASAFAGKDLGDDVEFAGFPPVKKMLADLIVLGSLALIGGYRVHVVKLR